MQNKLSHIKKNGQTNIVDISEKKMSKRYAIAKGFVAMKTDTLNIALKENNPKGQVIEIARIAAILAAKKTSEIIPLTHNIILENITVDIIPQMQPAGFIITVKTQVYAKTGVEIEAMNAVATAAVTIYDMLKAVQKSITIKDIRIIEKSGGKSGLFINNEE